MTLKKLKETLIKDIIDYPFLYKEEYWVFDILTMPKDMDDMFCHTEWTAMGQSNDGKPINRLSNFFVK